MAFDTLSASLRTSFTYNVGKNAPSSGLNFPAPSVSGSVGITTTYQLGGNVAAGINEVIASVLTIAANGSATIDLTNLTDVMGFTGVSLARLKEYFFCLLSAAQDSVNGTVCSSVAIGNAGSNGNKLNLDAATDTLTLLNSDQQSYATASAAGLTVDSTHKNVLVTNNDATHGGSLLTCLGGATT